MIKSLKSAIKLLSESNLELNGVANIVQFNDLLKKCLEKGDIEQAKHMSDEIASQAEITMNWLRSLAEKGLEVPVTYTDFIHMEK